MNRRTAIKAGAGALVAATGAGALGVGAAEPVYRVIRSYHAKTFTDGLTLYKTVVTRNGKPYSEQIHLPSYDDSSHVVKAAPIVLKGKIWEQA